jgi:predicted porin
VSISESILLALVTAAFSSGVTIATLYGKVDQALRAAQRAHTRIDELEQQTGTHTVLRADDTPDPRPRRRRWRSW